MTISHSERMKERRIRQLARTPGFTPVPNARIEAKIKATEALLATAAAADKVDVNPVQLHMMAVRQVAASLPPVPIGVRTNSYENRSKY